MDIGDSLGNEQEIFFSIPPKIVNAYPNIMMCILNIVKENEQLFPGGIYVTFA